MKKYMGYQMRPGVKDNEEGRSLPTYIIGGNEFIVDLKRHEFREVGNPANRFTIGDAKEEFGFTFFHFDQATRNLYTGETADSKAIPEQVIVVVLPPLKFLDPIGLARRQGLPDNYFLSQLNRNEELIQLGRGQKGERKRNNDMGLGL